MCGPKFCSMKITQEVRDFAAKQNQEADSFLAANPPRPGEGDHAQHIGGVDAEAGMRSEEHTSELQSLMRTSYAVFCLKKKTTYYHTSSPSSISQQRTQIHTNQ